MSSAQRHILVISGSRAELGLLMPVIRAIDEHPRLKLSVVLTGLHLVQGTDKDLTAAGFRAAAKVRMQKAGEIGRSSDVQAIARGIAGLGQVYEKLRPDCVLVLGDRIEVLAAAAAAQVGGYRLAHMHGGDRAEGVADESIRHAVSKLAHLHFPATPQSARRLARLGERRELIHTVGSPAVDGFETVAADAASPEVIIVQHPVGHSDEEEKRWMLGTLAATRRHTRLVLAPNGDPGSRGIRQAFEQARVQVTEHIPRDRFRSLLAGAGAIVGNSSAGLIDAAIVRTPCVNIGPRQAGRERPSNVVDCDYGEANVRAALEQALKLRRGSIRHPYGDGNTGNRVAHLLATLDLQAIPLRKQNAY